MCIVSVEINIIGNDVICYIGYNLKLVYNCPILIVTKDS